MMNLFINMKNIKSKFIYNLFSFNKVEVRNLESSNFNNRSAVGFYF